MVEGERRSPRVPLVLSVTSVPPTGETSRMALTNSPWIPDPCDSARHTLYKTKQNKGEELRIVEVNICAGVCVCYKPCTWETEARILNLRPACINPVSKCIFHSILVGVITYVTEADGIAQW